MSEYFNKLPVIKYQGRNVRDISRRVAFLKSTVANPFVFLPYTVEENDKPEDVAYYYYGSTEYVWMVYLANNIVDPYHDWPLSEENFNQYLMQKYKEESGREEYEIVDWTRSEAIDDNVVYYYKEIPDNVADVSQYIPPSVIEETEEETDYNNTTVVIDGVTYTLIRN